MPLIKIENKIIPVVSNVIEEEPGEMLNCSKIKENTVLVRIGPIDFQATKDFEPYGKPLLTIKPIELEFPASLFLRPRDNNNTLLRRFLLFFKGFCDILCPYSVPINCMLESNLGKSKMMMGMGSQGSQQMDKRWPFIPTTELWKDFEKELMDLPIILKKDRHLLLSLLWLGHRLESKTQIQSFLDSYRIIENLATREMELILSDVNNFLQNDPKWKKYRQCRKPLELDLKEGNFVKNFLISRWNVSETQWDLIKGLRDAIVHGETPDVEFRNDFNNAFPYLDNLTRVILTNEIKPVLSSNILICGKEIFVTETANGEFIMKPLHECFENPESIVDYRLEGLSKTKFELLVSNLNPTEVEYLRNYCKYRSHELLIKDVPTNIRKGKGITMQDHDHGGTLTISPGDS